MSANKRYSKAQMARSQKLMEEHQERAKQYASMTETAFKKTHFPNLPDYGGRNYWQPNLRYCPAAINEEEKTGIRINQLTFMPQVQWVEATYRGD
mmetsp:Transcript_69190/g.156922  ORF Transcript_69190/g.156922 Transcript_69190/m.156922 type:complete len:95 (-) Transcript_69190:99-383(-)